MNLKAIRLIGTNLHLGDSRQCQRAVNHTKMLYKGSRSSTVTIGLKRLRSTEFYGKWKRLNKSHPYDPTNWDTHKRSQITKEVKVKRSSKKIHVSEVCSAAISIKVYPPLMYRCQGPTGIYHQVLFTASIRA